MTNQTPAQLANLATVAKWAHCFNLGEVARMIDECYVPGAEMRVMGFGAVNDREGFLAFEESVSKAAPKRYITIEATHPCGENMVVVEALLFNPDQGDSWSLPWCTFLTFANGKITCDRNYLDFSKWPSFDVIQTPPETLGN